MPKCKKPVPAPEMAPDLVLVLSILKAMQTYLETVMPKGEGRSDGASL